MNLFIKTRRGYRIVRESEGELVLSQPPIKIAGYVVDPAPIQINGQLSTNSRAFFKARQVGEMLKLSDSTLVRLLDAEKFRGYQIGSRAGHRLFSGAQIYQIIMDNLKGWSKDKFLPGILTPISLKDVSIQLGLNPMTIMRACKSNQFPHLQFQQAGKYIFYQELYQELADASLVPHSRQSHRAK